MINITLKDGTILEKESGITAYDVAVGISEGLARMAVASEINGEVCDLTTVLDQDSTLSILTFNDKAGKKVFWHTASHILASAVKTLYPDAKLAIGPAIDNGFYYDFDCETNFSEADLEKIQAEMKKIVKANYELEKFTLPRLEAIKYMEERNEPYKVELIQDLPEDAIISFYKMGDFVDLCAGPHIRKTGVIKALKLLSCTGAYWRGNSDKKMLRRIYGTAFLKNADLNEYIERIEEAKKRDHNKIGRELGFFTTVDAIGQGLPILLPKGAKTIQLLQRFVEDEEERRGYLLTKTPLMAKSDLYKISGHWDHYKEGMFVMGDESIENSEVFALRPMTCPFQYQVFLAKQRSYRELPMRLGETSTLFRNESSGEMHGLIRVRQFTISEGHIICTREQLEDEFKGCIELANFMLETLGLKEDVSYQFSKWDPSDTEKYIGTAEQWDQSQDMMGEILDHLEIPYTVAIGDAAFYGPKLDIQIKNVHGKEDTIITIQIDELLAEKFGMEYVSTDGTRKNPAIIHRTSIGCYERTLALLLEKYAGALPLFLAPEQVRILPVTDRTLDYSYDVLNKLKASGFRVTLDDRSEKTGYKIREAQLEKVPYMLILGDKEADDLTLSVRDRKTGETSVMSIEDFTAQITKEQNEKTK